jgi:hypothetical protein
MLLLGLFFLFFFILGIKNILSIGQIIIKDEGIEKIFLISRKKQFVPFVDVIEIESERKKFFNSNGALVICNPRSVIVVKDKRHIFFSREEFDNYENVLTVIRSRILQSTSHNTS